MSIIEKLQEERTGLRMVSDFRDPPTLDVKCGKTGDTRIGLDANEEYVLKATVAVSFWANQAQYSDGRKHAETVLLHRLYEPLPRLIRECMRSISDGDSRTALKWCARMLDEIGV